MQSNSSKYFELYYDALPFPVEVFDENGFVIYINKAFSKRWGYTINELDGYSYATDKELHKREIVKKISNVRKQQKPAQIQNYVDTRLLGSDKAVPILKTTIFPLNLDDKSYIVFFYEDQTDVLLAEEEVRKARDSSKEADRLKSTFLNVLSHELRTPLNIILGYSTIIKENLKEKINSEDKIYLDNLYTGSERLFKSITQMLEFAQIEAGNYKLNLETVNLIHIIKNCLEPFKIKAAEKKLDFTIKISDDNIYVEVDQQSVEAVINNLTDNAIKFTRQGYIEVEVQTFADRELAVCKIKDTGVGISTEYLDHLYRPFSQEELDIGRNFEGNGLGLAISKRYIEKMGGSLIVDSIKGVGSTFTFTLPLAKVSRKEKSKLPSERSNGVSKILMLDDSGDSYPLIKAFLKDNFEVKLLSSQDFNSGLMKEQIFSAIIFDVAINYWNRGLEIVRNVRKDKSTKVPIVILSSEFLQEKIQQFRKAGADEFLVKPFAKGELVSLIKKIAVH
ncbi:MAG: response regulator [bacterium]|nr:response regulator [bacterium]